ncbi:DUF6279 family lipoprotein [Pseudoalteromonas luteoviolacea]|uniref:Lipoprotein n=1 Tax=Pseudoalteromonas luteoviolacea H33 TaxID=1365251 RepID=A0A167B604_9GAMM|nr:DUF6279 family lipoprotein [Pseudoalteromonas luteoviolacea]KZN46185.1 hypothetical protein N476_03420 [Pseudoalteromonas luteoviolacea H33]KZN75160.1 hypothetical protein N477_19975 [Pseudoalteromonas luteoviolacea H33-S]MBQ4875824.1 hypothetical protein [Pseudoalteromonas luteoviolacea]MBQ4904859.1 hypothetical protein [Pseudoalteromonas luteoviolacea]
MFRVSIVIFAVLMLTGCFYQTVYKNSDKLALNRLEEYVDLNKTQRKWVLNEVQKVQIWHQTRYLPIYLKWHSQLQTDWQSADRTELYSLSKKVSRHWFELLQDLEPIMVEFLLSLDAGQRVQFIENIKEKMAEQQSTKERVERTQERFEKSLGRLSDEQLKMIQKHSESISYYRQIRNLNNQKRLLEIETILLKNKPSDTDLNRLGVLIVNHPNSRSEYQVKQMEKRVLSQIDFLINLRGTLTVMQKREFEEQMIEIGDILSVIQSTEL